MDQQRFENSLGELAFMIQQLDPNQRQPQQLASDPYPLPSYAIDQYPQLQDSYAGVFLENPFSQQPHQGWHDPYVEAYIPDWWDLSYLRHDSPSNQPYHEHQQIFNAPHPRNVAPMEQQALPLIEDEISLDDMVQQLAANNLKFQQRGETTFQRLETQLGQLVSNVNELRNQGFLSQPVADPTSNESVTTFCRDQDLSSPTPPQSHFEQQSVGQEAHFAMHVNSVDSLIDDACDEFFHLACEFPTIHKHSDDFYCLDCAGELHKCAASNEIDGLLTLPNTGTRFEHEHPTTTLDSHMLPIEDDSFVEHAVQVDGAPDLNMDSVVPSIQQPPLLECKPLLENTESAYLEGGDKLPVTIANNLQPVQEKEFLKKQIPMKKEMFPKQISITMVPCLKHELVPMRIQDSWRAYKLNQAIRKDRFHRPFIYQRLERLASFSHFCFPTRTRTRKKKRMKKKRKRKRKRQHYMKKMTWTNKHRMKKKEFLVGQRVLYNSHLKLMLGKWRYHWISPFVVAQVFPFGAVEIKDESNAKHFTVNGQRLKPFHEGFQEHTVEELHLLNPPSL